MKILAVMGSPKGKGAGYRIVRKIEARMKTLGPVDFEYLFLKNADLKQCTGCYACLARGEDKCPLKDGRDEIEKMLQAADGAILSTPMNVLNVSWLMSNFISRFAYANHRPRFHRLRVMNVVNMGGDSPKTAFALMRWALGGSRVVHELGVATPPWPQTERAVAKKERDIAAAADKFYRACLDTSPAEPGFGDLLLFYARKRIYLECREHLPADYAYYKDKTYYYETKINPLKAAIAKALVGPVLALVSNNAPGPIAWPPAPNEPPS